MWYEDVRTTPKLMTKARNMVFLDDVGYNYLQRKGSIMNSVNVERNREILEALEDVLGYFRQQGLSRRYHAELEHLAVAHVLLFASVRVLRMDRKNPLLGQFAAFVKERFPHYRENKYLYKLTRNQRLALKLVDHKLYGVVELLFRIKG